VHGLDKPSGGETALRLRDPIPRGAEGGQGKRRGQQAGQGEAGASEEQEGSGPSVTAPQVAALYNFPARLTGQGQSIALIELNNVDNTGKPTGTDIRHPTWRLTSRVWASPRRR